MKKLSLLSFVLVLVMLLSCFAPAFASEEATEEPAAEATEEPAEEASGEAAGGAAGGSSAEADPTMYEPIAEARFTSYDQVNSIITIIPAEGDQAELGYLDGVTEILRVDDLLFKDLNGNGELDVYEDWRADIDARVDDLISQLELEEKAGLFYHVNTCGNPQGVDFADSAFMFATSPYVQSENATFQSRSMWYYINVLKITSQLDNTNGTPAQQIVYHNAMQAIAEDTRLGIPVVISNDREYNAWGGMIDTPHDAFGAANDLELSEKLWTEYSLESRATGIHVVLHPYGQEIGSWNGEDPEYAGSMTRAEVNALQVEGGVEACMKHFIARGGDSSFQNARSIAQTVDNWMTAWAIALEANPRWVMTNGYGTGLTNTVHVDYDAETMSYLRDTLGFEGVIVSDWGDQGDSNSQGVTVDGVDILSLTIPERYAWTINLGMDQIGAFACDYDSDGHGGAANRYGVEEALSQGLISEERAYETCYRVLKDKFELGLFENPYSDAAYALSLAASEAFQTEQWEVTDMETLQSARNPKVVALERQLEAESTILIKNEDDLLPLEKGIKVYIHSTAAALTLNGYKEVLADYCELVEDIEEADVVVADCSQMNDAAEQIIDDAIYFEKKLVIVANCVDPNAYMIESADALLATTFSRPSDHGTGAGGFITTIEPIVLAQLLFGEAEPGGMVVKEIARDSAMDGTQWKDLAGDQGASSYVRLMLLATMKTSENNTTPNNWGDPLLPYKYGMHYGAEPEFVYDTLVLPLMTTESEEESNGSTSTVVQTSTGAKAGEPFTVYTLLWNNGDDGMVTVQAKEGDMVLAEKVMAVCDGSWRVVELTLTIDEPGEHVITVGDLTGTLNIAE